MDGHFPTHLGWKKPSAVGDHASSNGRAPIRGQYPFLSGSEGSIIDYETGSLQFWMGYTKRGRIGACCQSIGPMTRKLKPRVQQGFRHKRRDARSCPYHPN